MSFLKDWTLLLISIPSRLVRKLHYYAQTVRSTVWNEIQSKYGDLRKKYVLRKLSNIEHKALTALSKAQYRDALHFYTVKLDKISEISDRSQLFSSIDIAHHRTKCMFSIAAVRAKMGSWSPSVNLCVVALRQDATDWSTKALFQMLHSSLSVEEAAFLLQSLEDDTRCDEINQCSFDMASIHFYCPQRGKCCAAASVAGALNAMIRRREFTTDDALNEYISLFPKYAARLKRRSTKNIGNGNLKKAMKSMAERRIGMSLEFETVISGPRCKKSKGFYIVTKGEIKGGDLGRYSAMIQSYLVSENHVLIAHIKNHYCLVFGMRQNATTKETELLISRRGQSPKHWETMADFLMNFAKTKIYKLYAVKQKVWVE